MYNDGDVYNDADVYHDGGVGKSLRRASVATVEKTFAVLEYIADCGGATARDVNSDLGFPLPTVYRILQTLVQCGYLVHLRDQHRFELGYKLDRLTASLHRQVGVPRAVRTETARLHEVAGVAAYFAVYRGADVVVAYVADCPKHPRISPLEFGFHEAAHATAFGKIMLAGMTPEQLDLYLAVHGTPPLTPATITSRAELYAHLSGVARRGIAWENDEFVPGMTCAAVGVRDRAGLMVGAVAFSAPSGHLTQLRERELERQLRDVGNQVSGYYRSNRVRNP